VAETYTLDAQARSVVGKKVHQLRVQGLVPVVVYGARTQPIHLQIPYRPLEIALRHAGGTHLIDISFDGKNQMVITREVQRDILRGTIMHVDFLAVDASTRITTTIAVHIVGESPIVESRQAELQQTTSTLSVEALATDLVDSIEVDISNLNNIGDAIHVRDLVVSSSLTILNDPDDMIVRITPLRIVAEEVEEEVTEAVAAEPEVISKGKAEEEEEA
jgi:large subunit ribosomal protein L25